MLLAVPERSANSGDRIIADTDPDSGRESTLHHAQCQRKAVNDSEYKFGVESHLDSSGFELTRICAIYVYLYVAG